MQDTAARVLSCETMAQDLVRIILSAPDIAAQAKAGQFIHILVPDSGHVLRRPISLMAADAAAGTLTLAIQPKGAGTQTLCACKPGETIRVLGPLGTGFDGKGAQCVYFVGGGVGVAPICCAMDAFATAESRAFFGFRTAAHAYGMTQAPCAVTAVSDDGSLGERALVTKPLEAAICARKPDVVMACGPTPMLAAVQALCETYGVPCQLSLEERMGCGIGACLGCNVKIMQPDGGWRYKRVCKSGTFGFGREYDELYDIGRLGGISVKGLSLLPRTGNPPSRIAETPSGMLNSVGLQNPGVESFIENDLPWLLTKDVAVIANITGTSVEQYVQMAERLAGTGVHLLEMNISCPNVHEGGVAFGVKPESVYAITKAVKAAAKQPLIVKLTPNVSDITENALAAEEAGADAISMINTLTGIAVDVNKRRMVLANNTGGLSGPAVRPVALRMVWQSAKKVHIPIIGMGGIETGEDAAAFMLCGAKAVMVGTANFTDPFACPRIIRELDAYCDRQKVQRAQELVGTLAEY